MGNKHGKRSDQSHNSERAETPPRTQKSNRPEDESDPEVSISPGTRTKSTAVLALLRLRQSELSEQQTDGSEKAVTSKELLPDDATVLTDAAQSTRTVHLQPIAPMESGESASASRTRQPKFGFYRKQRCKQACEQCHIRRVKCEGGDPCDNCAKQNISCIRRLKKKRGPKPKIPADLSISDHSVSKTSTAADIANLVISNNAISVSTSRGSTPDTVDKRRSASPKDKQPLPGDYP